VRKQSRVLGIPLPSVQENLFDGFKVHSTFPGSLVVHLRALAKQTFTWKTGKSDTTKPNLTSL